MRAAAMLIMVAAALTACSSGDTKLAWLRADGQRADADARVRQQYRVDRSICGDLPEASNAIKECMAQFGYSRPSDMWQAIFRPPSPRRLYLDNTGQATVQHCRWFARIGFASEIRDHRWPVVRSSIDEDLVVMVNEPADRRGQGSAVKLVDWSPGTRGASASHWMAATIETDLGPEHSPAGRVELTSRRGRVMRALIAVDIDDDEFSERLIAKLRGIGYLVVEPEVAEIVITQVDHPAPGVRIGSMHRPRGNNDAGLSQFLPLPLKTGDVLSALLRMLIARKSSPGARRS